MKQLVNTSTIARIQTILEAEMQTACKVYRSGALTADGMGGFTAAADVLVENTICFVGELGSSTAEREIAAQNTEAVLFTLRMPHDSKVTKNHWITIDSIDYHVLGFADSDINVYKKVIVRVDR
jgi:hypothetical protein